MKPYKYFLWSMATIVVFFACLIAAVNATGYADLRSGALISCSCQPITFNSRKIEVQHCSCGNQECIIGMSVTEGGGADLCISLRLSGG